MEDDQRDDETYYRVDYVPSCEFDCYSGDYHAYGYERVCKHVHVGCLDVEVLFPVFVEEPCGETVDEDSDGGGDDDPVAFHIFRSDDFAYAFDHDQGYSHEEDDSIGH